MNVRTAKKMQKIIWHLRWILLAGIILYDIFSCYSSFQIQLFLRLHGISFALFFILGLLEDYFECKGSCKQ